MAARHAENAPAPYSASISHVEGSHRQKTTEYDTHVYVQIHNAVGITFMKSSKHGGGVANSFIEAYKSIAVLWVIEYLTNAIDR
jgi:hypothetical protein